MMDKRLLRSNGDVAHVSLEGQIEAERFVESDPLTVSAVVTSLCDAPRGSRDRQLLRGEVFHGLAMDDGWIFGFADRDGYVGYVESAAFVPKITMPATHRIAVGKTCAKLSPELKVTDQHTLLPFGARVAVLDEKAGWSRVMWARGVMNKDLYVPSKHLAPLEDVDVDPVDVAGLFLGVPYLWGGNSTFGIDCSGLVQAVMQACGWSCPGDSDLQEAMPGRPLTSGEPLEAGDLLFWKEHVAMAAGPDTLIHANAYHMMAVEEPTEEAIARIAKSDTGPVTSRLRPERQPLLGAVPQDA